MRTTQPDKWAALERLHGATTGDVVADELCKSLDAQGSLDVIRHGFKCYGKLIEAAFFRPAHGLNPEILELYAANTLTVTRQLHHSASHPNKSIDTVLSLNGIPVVTAELKNPMTGQTVTHAMRQYRTDRDPREPIFQFKKRALVHFAIDPDLVYMTTRLTGKSTFFLPFNLGFKHGAGNPERYDKHRTWYLWEQVWQRDSLLDIIGRFLHLEVKEKLVGGKVVRKETMIFPRYHQLDAVRQLERDASRRGPGNNYLIQHSAGSGKSNSIAWLAYRLAFLHDENDKRVFDSVVVITDHVGPSESCGGLPIAPRSSSCSRD